MSKSRYYPALDGLRGVAALCIVLMHRNVWFGLKGWLAHGYLAVDFFFMLSGFVIASAYEQRLRTGMRATAFLGARLIRLYPMLILGAALGALWGLIAPSLGRGGAAPLEIASLFAAAVFVTPTLTANAVGVGIFPLDPPIWSLFFELAINVAYVALLPWLSTARLAVLSAASLGALAMLAARYAGVDAGGTPEVFWGGFARVTFPFLAGGMLHRLRDLAPLARLRSPFWAQALILIAVLNIPPAGGLGAVFDLTCIALVFPALVISGSLTESPPAETRALKLMGDLSYPAYVLHYPMYVFLGGWGRAIGWLTPQTQFVFGLASLALILAASWAATVFYDRPVRAWLDGVAKRRAQLAEAG